MNLAELLIEISKYNDVLAGPGDVFNYEIKINGEPIKAIRQNHITWEIEIDTPGQYDEKTETN